jgi:hypothetical protein
LSVGDEAATVLGDFRCLPSFMPARAPASAPEFRKMTMVYLHNWMSGLQGTRKLVELWLPGSHDSGVYTDKKKGVDPGDSARCQYENIYEQASVGSRVFDIRVFLRDTGFLGRTKIPTMGHFFMDKASAVTGDWGARWRTPWMMPVFFSLLTRKSSLFFGSVIRNA